MLLPSNQGVNVTCVLFFILSRVIIRDLKMLKIHPRRGPCQRRPRQRRPCRRPPRRTSQRRAHRRRPHQRNLEFKVHMLQ